MLLRRVIEHVKAQNWTAVGLDFVIVVMGLFVGLQIDNWWQAQSDARQERAYLLALKKDFEDNRANLNDRKAASVEVIESMLLLLREAKKPTPDLTAEELNNAFRTIHSMPAFAPVERTYDNLVGSGDLKLIDSDLLLDALAEFERRLGIMALVQSTHEMELVETFQPYVIQNMDYAAVYYDRTDGAYALPPPDNPDRILVLLRDQEFKNVIVQKWTIMADLLEQMDSAIDESQAVIDAIDLALGEKSSALDGDREVIETPL